MLHPLLARTADPGKREVDSILSTFGLLFLLQGIALVAWTGNDRELHYLVGQSVNVFGTAIQHNRLIVVIAAFVLSAAVFAFLRYSTPGRAMRAIAVSPHTAPLVGIDLRKYSALAFATGAALAAVAGILLSSFRTVNPTMGAEYTLNALIVIVMGGIGNVAGGLVAALILGLVQTLASMLGQSALGTIIVFASFAAVLLWRPQGLFGSTRSTGTRTRLHLPKEAIAVAVLAAVAVVPYVADAYWLLLAINILTYVALATAWAFFSGPTRYVSLAASAFYGLGAYCVAVLATDYSYPVALIAAVGFTAVLSALVGLATLRLSGMYFVIFTFGLASLVSAAATWWEFNIAKSSGWYVFLSITDAQIFYQLLALCAAIIALWLWRDRTRMGFALTTLGADETVARQIGINTTALKIGTFVVSAVVMALAGAILAPKNSYVTAQNVFNPEVSVSHGDRRAARRRHLGVGADAGRGAADAGQGLPFHRLFQPVQRAARPHSARHRVLHPGWHHRPLAQGPRRDQHAQARRRASRRSPAACAGRDRGIPPYPERRCATARLHRPATSQPRRRRTPSGRCRHDEHLGRLLEVTNLSRHFGGLAALDGVSFDVSRGEVMGLVGPNGSGKTTLLNVVSGRLAPLGGEVRLARPIRHSATRRRPSAAPASPAPSSSPASPTR